MCILPGETFIESHLKSEGAFEAETVNAIVKAMTVYKDATFLGKIFLFYYSIVSYQQIFRKGSEETQNEYQSIAGASRKSFSTMNFQYKILLNKYAAPLTLP